MQQSKNILFSRTRKFLLHKVTLINDVTQILKSSKSRDVTQRQKSSNSRDVTYELCENVKAELRNEFVKSKSDKSGLELTDVTSEADRPSIFSVMLCTVKDLWENLS